jgi:uncharacterized linocin/CFP29 family protein
MIRKEQIPWLVRNRGTVGVVCAVLAVTLDRVLFAGQVGVELQGLLVAASKLSASCWNTPTLPGL